MVNSYYYYNNIRTFTNALILTSFQTSNYNLISPYINHVAVKISNNNNNYISLKAWKYNNCINTYTDKNNILQLECKLYDNYLKINYLYINNDYYSNYLNEPKILSNDEYISLKNAFICYIEKLALDNEKEKIIIDVHHNMKRYNHELKDMGFIITNRKCLDNSFWYEAEKTLKK